MANDTHHDNTITVQSNYYRNLILETDSTSHNNSPDSNKPENA